MKIVALLPVKNEGWVLDTYLSSLNSFCDLIVALDDGSTDNTLEILNKHNVVTVKNDYKGDNWAEHSMRQKLLEIGRENGGTHFVCLDGDEAFSSGFRGEEARSTILNLKKGEALAFRWVTLWKSINTERIDEPWDNLYKDFIFCDDEELNYKYKFMHVSRTPEYLDDRPKKIINIKDEKSVVLHFKFYNYSRTLYNLAWYRCSELIHNIRPVKKINLMYGITLDTRSVKTRALDSSLFKDLPIPSLTSIEDSWFRKQIFTWFEKFGIEKFEPLEIWQIDELRNIFIKKVGRKPVSQTYPKFIIAVNKLRNKILNSSLSKRLKLRK